MYSFGLHPLITRPTRITGHSKTLIDNIFTTNLSNIHSRLIINDLSDHLPIFLIFKYKHNNSTNIIYNTKRVVNDHNINVNKLKETNWNEILASEDVNDMYDTFTAKLKNIYNTTCPVTVTKQKLRKKPDKLWMTNSLKQACKKKNLLYRQFLKKRSVASEERYKRYKNKLTDIIRYCEEKKLYRASRKNKGNIKETWKIINCLINKKSKGTTYPTEFNTSVAKVTGSKNIATGFNNFLVNIGPSLANDIPKSNDTFSTYLSDVVGDTLFLKPVTQAEIINLVNNTKSKKSKDHDDIDMCLVKKIITYLVIPLEHIFNIALQTGVFTEGMQIARIIPILKNGNINDFTNYRPISLLSQFSKILEKIFHNRLMSSIEEKNILYESQYGFRKNMSTSLAILELVENITTSIDDCKSTVGIFIDLKKAFDTVDHDILIKKLDHYGVRGVANRWICSYLMNRSQYVCINDTSSECMKVTCGVPQGSILGPALFILYINDTCNVSMLMKSIVFADDTNFFYSGDNLSQVCETVSTELDKLHSWFQVNKLSLNVAKTNFMIFGNKQCEDNHVVSINGMNIKRVYVTKFLGLHIDSHLNWGEHINRIKSKISKMCL